MRTRRRLLALLLLHQGGWDEVLLIFGIPLALFTILRFLGSRKAKQEAEEERSPDEAD